MMRIRQNDFGFLSLDIRECGGFGSWAFGVPVCKSCPAEVGISCLQKPQAFFLHKRLHLRCEAPPCCHSLLTLVRVYALK